jgi:hypothetical protein
LRTTLQLRELFVTQSQQGLQALEILLKQRNTLVLFAQSVLKGNS